MIADQVEKVKSSRVCSFCGEPAAKDRPVAEGKDGSHICQACANLCQTMFTVQIRRRRSQLSESLDAESICSKLDSLIVGQGEAKLAVAHAAAGRQTRPAIILLMGGTRSAKILLARALAWALDASFACGDSRNLQRPSSRTSLPSSPLMELFSASEFSPSRTEQGVLYLEGVEDRESQNALFDIWRKGSVELMGAVSLDVRRMIFVCGGDFDSTNPVHYSRDNGAIADQLAASGADREWAKWITAIAAVSPIDETTLKRLALSADFGSMASLQS